GLNPVAITKSSAFDAEDFLFSPISSKKLAITKLKDSKVSHYKQAIHSLISFIFNSPFTFTFLPGSL
ncbi:MAG TPA: hypothetical protein H9951_20275, partial [Candidatus Bacteroides intestinigallinarum]|nr:hypothetical protein [Candidatus Bacteroides intestinigallinarum]